MKRTPLITLLPGLALSVAVLIIPTAAGAQQIVQIPPGEIARVGAGGQIRPLPPLIDATPLLAEAAARLAPRALAGEAAGAPRTRTTDAWSVGDRKEFWAIDFSEKVSFPYKQRKVLAECRAVGSYAYYFVEAGELDVVDDDDVAAFLEAYEVSTPTRSRNPSLGIYQNVTEVFGNPPDVDGDPKIVILISLIDEEATDSSGTAFYVGYFYPANQFADPVDFGGGIKQRSNHTEMLYVNSRLLGYSNPSDPATEAYYHGLVESTMAHEFQHLIQWHNDPDEILAVNEGLSLYSEWICGYGLMGFSGYVSRPNVDLLSWRQYQRLIDDYSRAALWTYYLGTRFGEEFISALAMSPLGGVAGIEAALTSDGSGDFAAAFSDFVTALYLKGDGAGDDRFETLPIRPWLEPQRHENLYPSTEVITLEARGAAAVRYYNATDLTVAFPDGLPAGVTARLVRLGDGVRDVSPLSAAGGAVAGLGTTYDEAAVVLTNAAAVPSGSFRVAAAAVQGVGGLMKYETGRPLIRLSFGEPQVHVGLRVTPEVAPARLTGIWAYLMGETDVTFEVRVMTELAGEPGTYLVNETPIFAPAPVTPQISSEGWVYVPVTDTLYSTGAGVDYLVSMRMGSHHIGYSDLNRRLGRSFLRMSATDVWIKFGDLSTTSGAYYLGDWMFRAEFAYLDETAPVIAVGLLPHPLFPNRAEVWVVGNEPLHHGLSTGTLTPAGESPVSLLFQSTLGGVGIVDAAQVLPDAAQFTLNAIGYDRYGGLSDTAAVNIGTAVLAAGSQALLSAVTGLGAVTLDVPGGDHRGTTLLLIPYDRVPAGLPGAPSGGLSALGAPVVSLGPADWTGPGGGAVLRLPVRDRPETDTPYHFARWAGGSWEPVPGGATVAGGWAAGAVPGGGWYRLVRGPAPPPVERAGVELLGNAPNPFNPTTRISFRIPVELAGDHVRLRIINVRGQTVRTLVDAILGAGEHTVTWNGSDGDGRDVATGIYLYRLEVGGTVLVRKMLLLR